IFRHLNMGKLPYVASLDGRSEIGLAALTITFVDVVVYVPIALMTSGVAQQFLSPFALTIAVATLASLLVSFTLTPLLASRFLRAGDEHATKGPMGAFARRWNAGFAWLEHRYQSLLRHSIPSFPNRWIVIAVGLATFAVGVYLPMSGK